MYRNLGDVLIAPDSPPISRPEGGIIAEVGFGNGEFLAHLARTNPNALIVGFEVSQWCVTKACRRVLIEGANVRAVWGDARYLLPRVVAPGQAGAVFMNFPCPWPKRRHADRRVASEAFASMLRGVLAPGGAFHLATDVEGYAEDTAAVFAAAGFDVPPPEKDAPRPFATKYERKWRAMGRSVFTVDAVKPLGSADNKDGGYKSMTDGDRDNETEIRGGEAPGVSAPATWDEALARLEALADGRARSGPGWTAVFKEVFASKAGAALVSVITSDEGFEQHFYIKAVPGAGAIRAQADTAGSPYRTPGVRAAMRIAARETGIVF